MGLFLERARSNVFENDRAHSLIAVFVNRAIFEVFYLKRLGSSAFNKCVDFCDENVGVVKGIEFSGSVARWFTSRVD